MIHYPQTACLDYLDNYPITFENFLEFSYLRDMFGCSVLEPTYRLCFCVRAR